MTGAGGAERRGAGRNGPGRYRDEPEPEGERPEVVFADVTTGGTGDVIGRGPGGTATERVTERVALWLSGHRRVVRAGTTVTVVLVLLAAGAVVIGQVRGPDAPELVRARLNLQQDAGPTVGWHSEIGARPAEPLVVGVPAEIVLRALPTGRGSATQVLGLTGPALTDPTPSPADVPAGGEPLTTNLDTGVDCTRVQLPVTAARYGLRVRVTEGGRSNESVLPGGDLAAWFARTVTAGCSSWLARRDLTVTQASAVVDRTEPVAALTLTVMNRGALPADLLNAGGALHGGYLERAGKPWDGTVPVTVPAHGTLRTALTLRVSDCTSRSDPFTDGQGAGSWTSAHAGSTLVTTLETLGLVGTAHPAGVPTDPRVAFGNGIGPTGVVMDDQVRAVLADALHQICLGRPAPFVFVDAGRGRWDAALKRLTVPVLMSVAGLRIRDGELTGDGEGATVSLETGAGTAMTVNRSGTRLSVTLAYRVDPSGLCRPDTLPELPGPSLLVHAVTDAGVRAVPFQLTLPAAALDTAKRQICPGP